MPDRALDSIFLDDLVVQAGGRLLVDGVRLSLPRGQLTGLVGASGSGKTLTCRSLLGLVDVSPGVVKADLTVPSPNGPLRPYGTCLGAGRRDRDRAFRPIRGRTIGYLPQHARAALDPMLRVGRQVRMAASVDRDPLTWLIRAGFEPQDAPRVARLYPHQLSGGMAQRVAIAQVLALGSPFLVADEPTTGLDAIIQRKLARQLRQLADEGLGVLMVTHDLALLRGIADRVLLMDGGKLVETFTADGFDAGEPETDAGRRLLDAARSRAW